MKDNLKMCQLVRKFSILKIKTTSLEKVLICMLSSISFNKNMDCLSQFSCNDTDIAFYVPTHLISIVFDFNFLIYDLMVRSLE